MTESELMNFFNDTLVPYCIMSALAVGAISISIAAAAACVKILYEYLKELFW